MSFNESNCKNLDAADPIIQAISEKIGLELSETQIEEEAQLLFRGYMTKLRYDNFESGKFPVLMMELQQNKDKYLSEFRETATKEYRSSKIVPLVARAENITVTKDELEAEAEALARRQNITVDEVKAFFGQNLSMLEKELLEKKVKEFLIENFSHNFPSCLDTLDTLLCR